MRACVRVVAEHGAYPVLESQPPVALRRAGDAIYLVGSAAGPLGGDEVDVGLTVAERSTLVIRSAAATVALAGRGTSCARVRARVGRGGSLVWWPEPTVVTERAEHVVDARVDLAAGAMLRWREEVVAGRENGAGGRARLRIAVDRGVTPLVRHEVEIGPGSATFPMLGSARAAGSILAVGERPAVPSPRAGVEHAVLELARDAVLITAVGAVAAVRALLDEIDES